MKDLNNKAQLEMNQLKYIQKFSSKYHILCIIKMPQLIPYIINKKHS